MLAFRGTAPRIHPEAWLAPAAPGTRVPPGVLALGVPARVVRPLAAAERRAQHEQAGAYVETARAYRREMR